MFCYIIPWFILGIGFGRCNESHHNEHGRDRSDDHHNDCINRRGYRRF